MTISAKSLLIGAYDPWDSPDPTTKRGLALVDADPLITEYADRWPTLMAKVVSLRGIVEVPNEEFPIVYAAQVAISSSILSKDCDERTETARFWLENSRFLVPFADDFSLIDVVRIEQAIPDSPFMGIAYECLPLRNYRPRRQPKPDDQIVVIRNQLDQAQPTSPSETMSRFKIKKTPATTKNSPLGYTSGDKVNPKYL